MHKMIKKLAALVLAVAMCVTLLPAQANASTISDDSQEAQINLLSADSDSQVGMKVEAGKSTMTITVNKVGTSGTAQLYRYDADEYYTNDSMHGMSKYVKDNGDVIAEYTCGTAQEVKLNRYNIDGTDNLYSKFYLVQDGKILVGPVYASDIQSLRNVEPFEQVTKKGLTLEDGSTIEMAKDMGVSNTVINMDLCSLILANEDEDGNPIDYSDRTDLIEFESNGEIYYFNEDYVKAQDSLISAYSKAGINVTLVVISWAKTCTDEYPSSLLYLAPEKNRQTMAFNTSTESGRKHWIAAMEFMASRYSKSSSVGLVDKYVIGNEIDYTYDWYLLQPNQDANGKYQRVEFNTFMEEFARTFRLANLAVKKYNSGAKVVVSLTHNWAMNCYDSYNQTGNTLRVNSYAPKDILDWLLTYEKARGDYDWGIAVHPYPIGTTSSKPTVTDATYSGKNGNPYPITGDWRTSPWITAANLELYQLYFEQPEHKYNGNLRTVSITETSICNEKEGTVSAAAYQTSINEQAASVAQYYYRAAHIDCIDAIAYFQPHDQATYKLGLMEQDGTEKPSYAVWKYVDTNKSFNYTNKYLKYLGSDLTSYLDVMKCVESDFNWDTIWDEDKIMVRTISSGDVTRSLETDKSTYAAGDAIMVTATGDDGDTVGLYLAEDDVTKADPIYSYPVKGTQNSVTYKSGRSYDILAYGQISVKRVDQAALKAGSYKLVLQQGDTGETIEKTITISSDYDFGSTALTLDTNKDVYAIGEEIIVTATGNSNCWVGIYGKDDKYGLGETTSIYWYYINDPDNGQLSGKPTIIQSTIHNTDSSNPDSRIAVGEYKVYLFDGSGGNDYNMIASKEISIVAGDVDSLTSLTYKLNDATSGYANGVVTVTKDASNEDAIDCVMYWADEDGKPLEGYTSLAKFKLTGEKTTHQMYTHTIIPEGAKKLIAYASNGENLSATAVSADLPDNCAYKFDSDANVEFQIISDTHVTTDSGATGEVKLANQHFTQMLKDVKANSKDSIGIFINGDVVNSGKNAEFLKVYNLYQTELNEGDGDLPELHIAIGNHDWMAGNPGAQFQKYAKIFNNTLAEQPENVYYDETVEGYHFIYLGGEQAGLRAVLSKEQIEWFDQRMAEISAEDPDKPVFVLLHQALYNTVAGTLSGQGWDGVASESALKKVMKKYGQIIIVGGHSHWELNSESCMYRGDESMPVALNTAAVGYLWSSYDVMGGEFEAGSHGYYVRVYDDKVVFLGRDFENGKFIPSAMFVLERNEIQTPADVYNVSLDGEAVNLEAKATAGGSLEYASSNTAIASVTEDGTVIAKREGEVDITITSFGTSTTVLSRKTVTVKIGDASVYRIYGDTRYETSFETAEALKASLGLDQFETIIVADGTNFADALSGSYLAYVKDAPIIMTNGKNIDDVQAYINENLIKGGTVYLLGGTKAVSDDVVKGLNGFTIERLWGATRYETNLEILKEAGVKDQDILVCTGTGFADSLSASATKKPILLVGDELSKDQKAYLKTLSTDQYYIIGGENAVSAKVEAQIDTYAEELDRIGGDTRFETSVNVAETFFEKPDATVLAYGANFPDGLCGGPLAMSMDAPLILVMDGSEASATAYMKKNGINSGMVLGGPTLISNTTAKTVFNLDGSTTIIDW